jgi:hypothetical protein
LFGLRRRFSSLLICFVLALLAAPPSTRAENASPPAAQTGSARGCGTTVEDKLAAARKALQSNDQDMRAALGCLIQATGILNDRLKSSEQRDSRQSGMMHMPVLDVPVKPGNP